MITTKASLPSRAPTGSNAAVGPRAGRGGGSPRLAEAAERLPGEQVAGYFGTPTRAPRLA